MQAAFCVCILAAHPDGFGCHAWALRRLLPQGQNLLTWPLRFTCRSPSISRVRNTHVLRATGGQDRCRWRDRPRGPRCRRGGERRPHQGRRSAARPRLPVGRRTAQDQARSGASRDTHAISRSELGISCSFSHVARGNGKSIVFGRLCKARGARSVGWFSWGGGARPGQG
jgi:hypothetical protein